MGIYILWVGAIAPGGAFQGGAILAAMWLLVMIAGLRAAPEIGRRWLRLVLVAGPAVFLAVGFAGFALPNGFLSYPAQFAKPLIIVDRGGADLVHRRDPRPAGRRPAGTRTAAMNAATLYGLCSAALVGLGLFGAIVHPQPLRKILAFNLLGGGVFLLFGVIARRGAAAGMGGDPVPQAMVITGIVVAFSATALAVALLLRLYQVSGSATLSTETPMRARIAMEAVADPADRRLPAGAGDRGAGCRRGAGAGAGRPPGRTHRPGWRCRPGSAIALAIAADIWQPRTPLAYLMGGWAPPLGIALRADGLSAIMAVTTAVVICAIGLFARAGFQRAGGRRRRRGRRWCSGRC